MADEQQHSMEEPLRAWADHRRRQAGPPFELHSVDRAHLHDAAKGVYGSGGEERPKGAPAWRALLPRLVGIGAFTGLVVYAVIHLAPHDRDAPPSMAQLKGEPSVSAADREGPGANLPTAARPGEVMAPKASVRPQPDLEIGPEATAAQAEPLDTMDTGAGRVLMSRYGLRSSPTAAEPEPSPPPSAGSDVTATPKPQQRPRAGTRGSTTGPSDDRGAVALESTASSVRPVQPAAAARTRISQRQPTALSDPDWQAAFVQQQVARRNFNAPPNLALQSFRLEQRGRGVRLLDSDGSVYEGGVVDGVSDVGFTVPQLSFTGGAMPANSVRFQVQGTNRSSQQSLMFQGLLVTGATDRIQGQAVIGGRDRVVIDAVGR